MTSQQAHLSYPKYRPDIDGLRAVAVLAVVAFHAFPSWVTGGFIGVDVFFVISGYLISTIIFENLDKGTFSFFEFYARRIKRIFPALILVLVSCFAFGWLVLLSDEYKQLGRHIAAGAGFISNFILWNEAGYFDNSAETKPLLHLWSMGIEEQFYIVWPLLLWFFWRLKFNIILAIVCLTVISFFTNIKIVNQDMIAAFYSPQTRFWELLCGSILAWGALYTKASFSILKNKIDGHLDFILHRNNQEADDKTLSNVLSLCGLMLLTYGFWKINKDLVFPGKWALIPVIGTMLLIAAGPKAFFNRSVLSSKMAVWFGLISFPLYLWHWPLLSFARILENETPSLNMRIAAVVLSVFLAWLTYKLVERPIRFGKHEQTKVATLMVLMIIIGYAGYNTYKRDGLPFRLNELTYENMPVKRKGFDQAVSSLAWYEGKGNWLFLGDAHDKAVSKLKLAIVPGEREVEATKKTFSALAAAGARFDTKVVLFVGPDKSSIYPEYLPETLTPSAKKYSSFFLKELNTVPNLTVYDPTVDLLRLKRTEGILYWMTDTHWNDKGAYLAYSGFSNLLGLPVPQIEFQRGLARSGDIIKIANLKNFPLHADDNWTVIWKKPPTWTEIEIPDEQKTAFGSATVVTNQNPLANKRIWVVGDSFANGLKPYFNASFKEVRYVGHWNEKHKNLPGDLVNAESKPDLIVVVRVERAF